MHLATYWSGRSRRHEVQGYVDHVDCATIRGWAWDVRAPVSRLKVDVFWRGVFLGSACTGAFRQDLLDQKIGDGCHGFVFHVPECLVDDVFARDVAIFTTYPVPVKLIGRSVSMHDDPDAQDQSTSKVPQDVNAFFRPLVRCLGERPAPMPITYEGERPRIDMICAAEPDSGVSAFARHIAAKYGKNLVSDDLEVFWRWYLAEYCLEKGAARAPLAATDCDALLRRGHPHARLRHRPFDWSIDEARRLFVEDCLIDPAVAARLRQVPLSQRFDTFPLSRFMGTFRAKHHLLRDLPIATEKDRIRFYAVIMFFALRDPQYLSSMPTHWLTKMLDEASIDPHFERVQKDMFGEAEPMVSRMTFRRHVEALGFDWATRRVSKHSYRGHRVRGGGTLIGGAPVDVQMIGPFKRSLGLAESCRRIAVALSGWDGSLNFVDYDIGCASPKGSSDVPLGEIRAAHINVLHLNAEEVPEAIAYLPDTFSRSRTILIPYWELDRPSQVHRLGLDLADEVWATTKFLASVFRDAKRVTHIGMSFDDRFELSNDTGVVMRASLGIPADHFALLTVADALSWMQRKNVLGAIEAFQVAFEGEIKVALIVKVRNLRAPLSDAQSATWAAIMARCAGDPRIRVLDTDLSDVEQRALLSSADGLLSLHRAEGLGFDILDALYLETPVVATAYSGNMDVCTAATCWLVDYDLVRVDPDDYAFVEPGHVWANPRLASAVATLRALRADTATRARKVAAAQTYVRDRASPHIFAARLAQLVRNRLGQI